MVKADFFAVRERRPRWGQVFLPVEGLRYPVVVEAASLRGGSSVITGSQGVSRGGEE